MILPRAEGRATAPKRRIRKRSEYLKKAHWLKPHKSLTEKAKLVESNSARRDRELTWRAGFENKSEYLKKAYWLKPNGA